jgi:hypothetical protein
VGIKLGMMIQIDKAKSFQVFIQHFKLLPLVDSVEREKKREVEITNARE